MKTIVLAQMKKDLIPLRRSVGGLAILAMLAVVCWSLKAVPSPVQIHPNLLPVIFGVLAATLIVQGLALLIGLVLVATLVVRIVHQDSLVDPFAFWRTRPITRPQLLGAKGLFVLPGIILVLALSLFWGKSSWPKEGEGVLAIIVFLSGLTAFASVTSNFSQMFGLFCKTLLLYIPFAMVLGLLTGVSLEAWSHQRGPILPLPFFAPSFASGFSLATQALVSAGFLAVVIHQYLTLRTEKSVKAIYVITITGFLMASLVQAPK